MSYTTSSKKIGEFRRTVRGFWKKHGRHDLPWRKTHDPYRIMVSEIMLQQTQVPRVIEKYKEFLRKFPTARALAKAPLSDVLKVWSGLGYNRRGKYLHDAAKFAVAHTGGINKNSVGSLKIPGVGPYTRAAVLVFAFNEPMTMIETNIRTAFIHHFFPDRTRVHDRELIPLIEAAAEGQDPRQWHWALMDYGAHLKKSGVRNNAKSAHYVKQKKFKGSLREVRGAVLRELSKGPSFVKGLPFERARIEDALASLQKDGLIKKARGKWCFA